MNNIKAVALIADKKAIQPALQVVYFTGEQAVATDGFILALTDSNIPEQKRFAAPYQEMKGYSSVNDDGSISIKNKLTDNPSKLEPGVSDCDYPRFEQFNPIEEDNQHLKIGLSVSVLEKLIKSLKAADASIIEVSFNKDPLKPILVYPINKKIKYVVMPARLETRN